VGRSVPRAPPLAIPVTTGMVRQQAEPGGRLHLLAAPAMARPTGSPLGYRPYVSAVWTIVTPRSRSRWIVRTDSVSSLVARRRTRTCPCIPGRVEAVSIRTRDPVNVQLRSFFIERPLGIGTADPEPSGYRQDASATATRGCALEPGTWVPAEGLVRRSGRRAAHATARPLRRNRHHKRRAERPSEWTAAAALARTP